MNPLPHQIPLHQDAISECHHRFFSSRQHRRTPLLPDRTESSPVAVRSLTLYYHRRPAGLFLSSPAHRPGRSHRRSTVPLLHRPLLFPIGSGLLCPPLLFLIRLGRYSAVGSALECSARLSAEPTLISTWLRFDQKKRELSVTSSPLTNCHGIVGYQKKLFLCAFAAARRCLSCALTVVMSSSLTSSGFTPVLLCLMHFNGTNYRDWVPRMCLHMRGL
jgi:hypothetical protein